MTLVLVEVAEEALERLTQNADVRVVGILTKPELAIPAAPAAAARKWAGSLSDSDATSLHAHVEQLRSEWERDIY
jgi:hypothetical protein